MTAVKRSGTTETIPPLCIRKDSEGVFLYIYVEEEEEALFYEWNINDDHCHCGAWWSISSSMVVISRKNGALIPTPKLRHMKWKTE